MNESKEPTVWGVFVGDKGDQLETFNSRSGPFPPEPGTEGYIAIGWPAIGDMNLYKDNYHDFVDKFRIVYPHENERAFKTQANMTWNFAFSIQDGDWVLCPSSASGYLLVGKVIGDYVSDFHNETGFAKTKRRSDFVHLRKVQWLYIVGSSDVRYEKLHRIGQLTVVKPDISISDLRKILNGEKQAA
jgi:predicted Mrr-cat superfamily restriction endonuclease